MNRVAQVAAGAVAIVLAIGAAPAYAADPDTSPPQIVSVSYSKSSVSVSGLEVVNLTVNVRLTDNVAVEDYYDMSEINFPDVRWTNGSLMELHLSSGTPQDGIWSAVAAVNSGWDATNQLDAIEAGDGAGNVLRVDPRTVITVPTLTVARSHHPDLTITADVVVPPKQHTVVVTARDSTTGKAWPGLKVSLSGRAGTVTTNAKGTITTHVPSVWDGDAYVAQVIGPVNPGQFLTVISYADIFLKIKYVISAAPAARTVTARTNVDVTGHLYPAVQRKALHLQRLYGRTWRTVNDGATRSSGRYTLVATPPKGLSYYRVYVPGDADSAGNTSATFTITGR
jgi:hypothetical protein